MYKNGEIERAQPNYQGRAMKAERIAAAKNLMAKLNEIPHPQAMPRQHGRAEEMLFDDEYSRLIRSLNAIPVEIVREAEREIYGQYICQ